jgi:hypothetical protein
MKMQGKAMTPRPENKIMDNTAPYFGEYVRLVKAEKILKWVSYDPENQTLELESPEGLITVNRCEVALISENEKIEFLLKIRPNQ